MTPILITPRLRPDVATRPQGGLFRFQAPLSSRDSDRDAPGDSDGPGIRRQTRAALSVEATTQGWAHEHHSLQPANPERPPQPRGYAKNDRPDVQHAGFPSSWGTHPLAKELRF